MILSSIYAPTYQSVCLPCPSIYHLSIAYLCIICPSIYLPIIYLPTYHLSISYSRRKLLSVNYHLKAREFQKKNIYFCFLDYAKAFDCGDHNKLWKILKEMGISDLPLEKSVCKSGSNS